MSDRDAVLAELHARREALLLALNEVETAIGVLERLDEPPVATAARPTSRARSAPRLRYLSALPFDTAEVIDVEALPGGPQERQVLKAVHEAGPDGALARDIAARTGLPPGSTQWVLKLLRDQGRVTVKADPKPPK